MNPPTDRAPVLVGVSRSQADVWAVSWAADEAAARGLPLLILHAQEWPSAIPPGVTPGRGGHLWAAHFRAAGQALVDTARAEALHLHPELDISVAVAEGKPGEVLRRIGGEASLVVLGTRRLSDAEAPFARSRGAGLFGDLPCPVALVPRPEEPQPEQGGTVVVGVDGSAASEAAVAWAYEEAALTASALVAVEVRRPHSAARPGFYEEARLELAEALAGWAEKYPEIEVEQQVLTGHPAYLLAGVAREARCLVVGSHGRGGWHEALLGSTPRSLVHHTHGPLVVVPPQHQGRP
ncbi:universal stress protein [Streptacidiphilus pinicola]|uniref:Universal stress protein n=1 Tax=Streptacidiphilus pinicola TaxID=2219663 RepID=A0A2X0J955_9ACTN|nr:universal stress protein [Streptacidiphilus pinicola]RAG86826.1 universal stress protein [Streptacidiphilus pinicola]